MNDLVDGIRHEGDITINKEWVEYHIRKCDVILPLVAIATPATYVQQPLKVFELDFEANLPIVRSAVKYKKHLVFPSTSEVYGDPLVHPQTEAYWGNVNPIGPRGVYDEAKRFQEAITMAYHRFHQVETRIVRIFNTYGPRMRVKDARQTFVGVWVRQLIQGDVIEVWGGEQQRDFTYVDDAVEAFLLAATKDEAVGEVFNLGGPPPVTLQRLAELMVEVNQGGAFAVRTFPAERKKIDIGDYYADDRKIGRMLGWKPRTDLRVALTKTLAYYRKELPHYL
jgi:UDP-glucose 4-epimerase